MPRPGRPAPGRAGTGRRGSPRRRPPGRCAAPPVRSAARRGRPARSGSPPATGPREHAADDRSPRGHARWPGAAGPRRPPTAARPAARSRVACQLRRTSGDVVGLGGGRGLAPVAERRVGVAHLVDVRREPLGVGARGVVRSGSARSRVTCFSRAAAPRATAATAVTGPSVWSDQPTGTPERSRMVTIARRLACSIGRRVARDAVHAAAARARRPASPPRRPPRPRCPSRSSRSPAGRAGATSVSSGWLVSSPEPSLRACTPSSQTRSRLARSNAVDRKSIPRSTAWSRSSAHAVSGRTYCSSSSRWVREPGRGRLVRRGPRRRGDQGGRVEGLELDRVGAGVGRQVDQRVRVGDRAVVVHPGLGDDVEVGSLGQGEQRPAARRRWAGLRAGPSAWARFPGRSSAPG